MIVEWIHARGFLSHEDSRVEFGESPLWLIGGDNGAGKSALLDAAEYALYGRHRGNVQNANLLVKHGVGRAYIEVGIVLDGERIKVQRTIDAHRGNLAGRVDRWDESAGVWQPVNVGDGVGAAWDWLARRLPSHDLFRSGIYLRQGDPGRFLSGDTGDRIKRFGALIDLRQYTRAGVRASERAADARERKRAAEIKLRGLGDISKEALERARTKRDEAREAHVKAVEAVSEAEKVTSGARAWAGLLERQEDLNRQKGKIEILLSDAEAIQAADRYVRAWDIVAASLAAYWQARSDAARLTKESLGTAEESCKAQTERNLASSALEGLEGRLDQLRRADLPSTRVALQLEEGRVRDLDLEARVANARVALTDAERRSEQLRGKDVELEAWQHRERAIPLLRALASARAELGDALTDLGEATLALTEAEDALKAAKLAHEKIVARSGELSEARENLQLTATLLASEIARLEGRVLGHKRLTGEEPECPVCAQPLDERAHTHVREILAEEHRELDVLHAQREQVATTATEVAGDLKAIGRSVEAAQRRASEAGQLVAGLSQRLTAADGRVKRASRSLEDAGQPLRLGYPQYADRLGDIDTRWVSDEVGRIRDSLARAQPGARELQLARDEAGKLLASLSTLRQQRREGTEPHGDQLDGESLTQVARATALNVVRAKKQVAALEDEEIKLGKQIRMVTSDVVRLEAEAKAASNLAHVQAKRAAESDDRAKQIQKSLGAGWTGVLASREEYDQAMGVIPSWRERASRVTELDQASGQLELVKTQLQDLTVLVEEIDPLHRIPIRQAEEREQQARTVESEVKVAVARAGDELIDLEERQCIGENLREAIERAAAEITTFGDLADLLKDGGPVQVWIAEREQQRLVEEANEVLTNLADPLRLVLGQPRRKQGDPGLRDVLVLDTSDTLGKPRYFEFLSGGEQFRVALSLALALHRSVSGGAPGTIFVDEGFGSLDEHRRDALAYQLTDSSQGILRLGLAHSIIICSHSAEVQRHFLYRWLVRKSSGAAVVRRYTPDDRGDEDAG